MEQLPCSRKFVKTAAKAGEDPLKNVRERPTTVLTPETKRSKTVAMVPPPKGVLVYPEIIPVPSQKVIGALYNASLEEKEDGLLVQNMNYNDQRYLKPAGVLSFEQILLPALGLEEENALKKQQAMVQRDSPEYQFVMEHCRRLVRESIRRATDAVQSTRTKRVELQQDRRQEQLVNLQQARETRHRIRQEEKERRKKEQLRAKEIFQADKKRSLAREFPRNQELWKEIVFLTSSVTQLEREERMWIQIEKQITQLAEKKSDIVDSGQTEDTKTMTNSTSSALASVSENSIKALNDPFQIRTEEKVRDIVLASTRIQKGLTMVLELLDDSEVVRKQLYDKYRNNHVFSGYQAVNNPKGMIRFLSQSQDDHF